MKKKGFSERDAQIMECLAGLPHKMLSLHGIENMTEFVMHELCGQHCFNFERAAYFIDNPDFNCLKGVAGFARSEAFSNEQEIIWVEPRVFSAHMEKSPFNQKVRGLNRCSLRVVGESEEDVVAEVAHNLGFKNHAFCSWGMKHDNHGLLVFEKTDEDDVDIERYLQKAFSLLGFCPIF